MKNFSDLGINVEPSGFTGPKIKIGKILNKQITVEDYRIGPSKFAKNGEECLCLQILLNGEKHIVFTGSKRLMNTIKKVAKADMPFTTTIIEEDDRYEFS